MFTQSWQEAFLGVSAILGERLDDSLGALGDDDAPPPLEFVRLLRSPSREVRARAIARSVATVVADLDQTRFR